MFLKSERVFKCVAENIPPGIGAAAEVVLLVLSAGELNADIYGPISRKF